MKNIFFLFLIFSLTLPSAFLHSTEVVDRVVAIVGGEMVTLSDVKKYSQQRSLIKDKEDPLDALIGEKLLKQDMEHLGITVSDEDISNALQEVLARNKMSLDALKSEISRKGASFDAYKKDLSGQIRQMKFMAQVIFPRIKLTDEEIAKRAGPNPSEQARMNARLLLLQERAPDEIKRYVDELRAKTYVEIKK